MGRAATVSAHESRYRKPQYGVRVTHIPTGMEETCDRFQTTHANLDRCIDRLQHRLDDAIFLRYGHLAHDLKILYAEVRSRLQEAHLQTIAFAPNVSVTEDALQRWRRGDTKQPNTVYLLEVAAYLGIQMVWTNALTETYPE